VNCRELEHLILSSSGAPLPPEAAAHAAGCERCRPLVRALSNAPGASPLPAESLQRIQDKLTADLQPVRPLPPPGLLSLGLVGVLLVLTAIGVAVLGPAGWRVLSLWQRISVFPVLAAAAGLLAFSLGRQCVPGSRLVVSPFALLAAVGGATAVILAVLFEPHEEAAFIHAGLVCLAIGLAFAIPSGFLLHWVLRRTAILNPGPAGATSGALAGLTGLLVLEFHCPNLNQHHILVWHLGAVLISAAGGCIIAIRAARAPDRSNP